MLDYWVLTQVLPLIRIQKSPLCGLSAVTRPTSLIFSLCGLFKNVINGFIQYLMLFFLKDIALRLAYFPQYDTFAIHLCCCIINNCFFYSWTVYPLEWIYYSFVYPFPLWRTFGLPSIFDDYEYRCLNIHVQVLVWT